MPQVLDDTEIDRRLTDLTDWSRDGNAIRRSVKAADFPTAIKIVDDVAKVAEEMDHHPDIDIRWRTLHFTLSTHDAGGITALDTDLAQRIDEIAEAHQR
jgi:4a-hydroxytetrahydrobiopterin dehydratase